jgi:hypothetical protein
MQLEPELEENWMKVPEKRIAAVVGGKVGLDQNHRGPLHHLNRASEHGKFQTLNVDL